MNQYTDALSLIHDGFGDLCLAPSPFACSNCDADEDEKFWDWKDDGGKAMTCLFGEAEYGEEEAGYEADSFEHEIRPCPSFFTLPKEVRDIIFDHCIAPFQDENAGDIIVVHLHDFHSLYLHPLRGNLNCSVPLAVPVLCDSGGGRPGRHIELAHYNTLRALSNVCKIIRSEIHFAFWSRVSIDSLVNRRLVQDFIEQRPRAANCIRRLEIHMESHVDKKVFAKFIGILAQHVNLELLHLTMYITPTEARNLIANGTNEDWVLYFRAIKTNKLTVCLHLRGKDVPDMRVFVSGGEDSGDSGRPIVDSAVDQDNMDNVPFDNDASLTSTSSTSSSSSESNDVAGEQGESSTEQDTPANIEDEETIGLELGDHRINRGYGYTFDELDMAPEDFAEYDDFDDYGYELDDDECFGFDDSYYDDDLSSHAASESLYYEEDSPLANILGQQIEKLLRIPPPDATVEDAYLELRAAELAEDEVEDD